ncbi:hypothetical protein ABID26_004614 [Mesorhizobium shonense]|uniref:Transposase n=1 Tax=Mesorhizobium shonense TaxID=1209948 RepID=A0ABV2HYN3_9HYPH
MRVIEEDIDVVTFAMINLNHHGRAAAKRPLEVVAAGILPKLINQVAGDAKNPPPLGRAPVISLGHHAASG